jgi:hypothetical protein
MRITHLSSVCFAKQRTDDMGIDGYAVPFLWGYDYNVHFYLFMDAHGGSAAIASPKLSSEDLNQDAAIEDHASILSDHDKEPGVIPTDPSLWEGVRLYETDFEEFLVRLFFELWAHIALEVKDQNQIGPMTNPLKEFLVNVYAIRDSDGRS